MTSIESASRPSRYRVSLLVTPKAEISREEFHRYWAEHHVPLFHSLPIVKKNLLKYEQFHIDHAATSAHATITGNAPMPYGGVAIFEAETLEKILEIFKDEDYLRVVAPDTEKFVDPSGFHLLAGHYSTTFNIE